MMQDQVPVSRGMKVFRLSGGSEFRGRVCSASAVWVRQHWLRRAEICCWPNDCPACEWQAARSVGFLAVLDGHGRVGLLEISPTAFERFAGLLCLEHGVRCQSMVGVPFVAVRRGDRCPLMVEPCGEALGVIEVGAMRLADAVACLYRLPGANPGETPVDYTERCRELQQKRLAAAVSAEQHRLARR